MKNDGPSTGPKRGRGRGRRDGNRGNDGRSISDPQGQRLGQPNLLVVPNSNRIENQATQEAFLTQGRPPPFNSPPIHYLPPQLSPQQQPGMDQTFNACTEKGNKYTVANADGGSWLFIPSSASQAYVRDVALHVYSNSSAQSPAQSPSNSAPPNKKGKRKKHANHIQEQPTSQVNSMDNRGFYHNHLPVNSNHSLVPHPFVPSNHHIAPQAPPIPPSQVESNPSPFFGSHAPPPQLPPYGGFHPGVGSIPSQDNVANTQVQNGGRLNSDRGTSQYRGVSWHKRDKRWTARAWISRKSIHLGAYVSEKLAAFAVDLKIIESGTNPSRVNFDDITRRQVLRDFLSSKDTTPQYSLDLDTLVSNLNLRDYDDILREFGVSLNHGRAVTNHHSHVQLQQSGSSASPSLGQPPQLPVPAPPLNSSVVARTSSHSSSEVQPSNAVARAQMLDRTMGSIIPKRNSSDQDSQRGSKKSRGGVAQSSSSSSSTSLNSDATHHVVHLGSNHGLTSSSSGSATVAPSPSVDQTPMRHRAPPNGFAPGSAAAFQPGRSSDRSRQGSSVDSDYLDGVLSALDSSGSSNNDNGLSPDKHHVTDHY